MGGRGLLGKTGYIWVKNDGGYIQNMEIPVSDNPLWSSFKLRLVAEENMSPEEWKSFVEKVSCRYLGACATNPCFGFRSTSSSSRTWVAPQYNGATDYAHRLLGLTQLDLSGD